MIGGDRVTILTSDWSQLYRSKMEAAPPFPASPLTSPEPASCAAAGPGVVTVEPPSSCRTTPETPQPPGRTSSPSIMTQTPIETRSLNSSNSKDSSGGQPLSEHLDSKGEIED